ncbi:MAG: DUF167 domain-containing protein [Patescibacteria group bacterium]
MSLTNTIPIKVNTHTKKNEIVGWQEGVLQIHLKTKPIKGQANKELCRLLANHCHLPISAITIKQGGTSRNKLVSISGLTKDKLRAYLD